MQRALIDGWLKAAVAADVEFARLALGLERRAKPVADIASYLKEKQAD